MPKVMIASDSDISGLDRQKFKSDAGHSGVENLYHGLFDLEVMSPEEPTTSLDGYSKEE
jgi:hypothetical protein